ncbi:AAA family ATPase [Thermodesulfobacteriota bacterium]
MKFTDFYINGFGLFHDNKIEGLSPGLVIFLGDNESGKSSLLGFIRAILFGFADGRSSENPYPPLAGGRHGRNIKFVIDGQKHYVVERYPGTRGGKVEVLKPDQSISGKKLLHRLLGIGNRTLYKNIYAFSLSELQTFETLNTEEVGETLYSAGAGIDPKGLAEIKSSLEKREGDLFKPGGSKPRINKILSRLMVILKEKKALQGSIEEYDRMRSQTYHLVEEIDDLEKRKVDLTIQLKKNEQWITILPEWVNLSISKQKLDVLDTVESFPSQGIPRLEGLKTRMEDSQKELLEKEEELKGRESGLQELKIDQSLLTHSSLIRRIQKDQGHFEAIVRDLLSVNQELDAGKQRLEENVNHLGSSWTEERVLKFDLSIATREEIRKFREILTQAKLEEQRKKDLFEEIFSRKREAEKYLINMDEPSVMDSDLLSRMKGSCRKSRHLESEDRLLKEELRYIDERLVDLNEEKKVLEEAMETKTGLFPFWPFPVSWGAGLILLILFGVNREWTWVFPAIIICFLFGLGLIIIRTKLKSSDQVIAQGSERRSLLLESKIKELEERKEAIKAGLDLIREQTTSARSDLSLPETPSGEALDQMEQELSEKIKQLDRWKEAEKALEQAENRYEEAVGQLQHAESEQDRMRADFQKWLIDRGLDPALSPDGVLETLSLIQSCREQVEGLSQLRSRRESLEGDRNRFSGLVNKVPGFSNKKPIEEGEIQAAVHILLQDYLSTREAEQKREILQREIEANRESVDRLRRHHIGLQEETKALMALGRTNNEEEFRERGQIFEKRAELMKDVERYEDSIRRLSGNLEKPEKVMEEISKIDQEELEEQKIRIEKYLKDAEETLDRFKKEHAKLEERVRFLVDDERVSDLRAEEEGLKEELKVLAEDWITIRLAKSLIRMARERYEKERQPEVISEAGRFFNRMTLGKYSSIVSPVGENRIEVVDQDNSRKGIEHLSRGTAEQLYLSLRFGFIREFTKRSNPLPVIMDEILVNFDLHRAKATVKGIIELSRELQVLFFTCHPYMVELFREADPDIPVLEISGGEVRKKRKTTP